MGLGLGNYSTLLAVLIIAAMFATWVYVDKRWPGYPMWRKKKDG